MIDPANGVDGVMDVLEQKIYQVGDCSNLEAAWQVDASSCLVTPGLVDSHMHLYRGGGFGGVSADLSLLPNGAICGIDAGSAGTMNYRMFSKGIVYRELSAVKALLNVSPAGLSINHSRRQNSRFRTGLDNWVAFIASFLPFINVFFYSNEIPAVPQGNMGTSLKRVQGICQLLRCRRTGYTGGLSQKVFIPCDGLFTMRNTRVQGTGSEEEKVGLPFAIFSIKGKTRAAAAHNCEMGE